MKCICLSAAILAMSAVSSSASDTIRWLNDWYPSGDSSIIYYGVASGLFKEAGIDVTIDSAKGSSDAITRVATGGADVAFSGLSALMQAKAESDVPVTAVMSGFNTAPDAIITFEGSGIETFADLKGKAVASAAFSSSNVMWPLILDRNGLKPDDVALQKTDPGALGAMLAAGQVDAVISWVSTGAGFETPLKEAGKTIRVLPWAEFGLDSYGGSVIVADRLITGNPDLIKRFVTAYLKAEEAARANPEAAVAALKAVVPEADADLGVKQLKAALTLIFNDTTEKDGLGTFTKARLQATWETVADAQGIDRNAVDPEAVVDRSFLPTN